MQQLGHHHLLDAWGLDPSLLDDPPRLATLASLAAVAGGATVVETRVHHFSPQGVSGVVILAESHLALHTWPEHGFAAFDVFTCGERAVAEGILRELIARLAPAGYEVRRFHRGFPGSDP